MLWIIMAGVLGLVAAASCVRVTESGGGQGEQVWRDVRVCGKVWCSWRVR